VAAPAPVATTLFADPAIPPPAFADPARKTKLLAVVPQLEGHFAELATQSHLPGLAVGLVIDGEMVWSKGYGVRNIDSKEPVDADTVFRLGSISKSFTGMAVLQLRDAGKLSLDDPAQKYVPELAGLVYPTRDAPPITIRHLLTHQAGLPHDPPVTIDETHSPSDDDALRSLQGMMLDAPPNVRSAYSNLGFELAGMIVSRVSGVPYREYVASHILRPLGMTSSGFEPDMTRLATGYVFSGKDGKDLKHPGLLRLGVMDPAGGLFSTVRDLARYAAFELSAWPARDDADDGPLRRSSVREAQRMAVWWALNVFPRKVGKSQRATANGYGFGWVAEETCDWDTAVWHNGGLSDGYHSVAFMLPEQGVAIVALTNVADEAQVLDQAVRDGARLLAASGALAKRAAQPTQAELAARDAVVALRNGWNDELAARTFSADAASALPQLKDDFAKDTKEHGACHAESTTAVDRSTLRWEMACERGGQSLTIALGAKDGRIATINGDDNFPPDPRLAAAGARLASLVQRWDDKVYDGLAAASLVRAATKAAFADAGAAHGSCKLDHAEKAGDKTHARFALNCARGGPLELRATLDDASGKVSDAMLLAPSEEGKKCP
jgi:CubicO group peptidase (beta-lactamase class C family)